MVGRDEGRVHAERQGDDAHLGDTARHQRQEQQHRLGAGQEMDDDGDEERGPPAMTEGDPSPASMVASTSCRRKPVNRQPTEQPMTSGQGR
jgi:hypothetical protein